MVKNEKEQVMEAAMEAGHILLENGAEISRVEETMDRICDYYGVSEGVMYKKGTAHFGPSLNVFL